MNLRYIYNIIITVILASCSFSPEVIDGVKTAYQINEAQYKNVQNIILLYEKHNKGIVSAYYHDMISNEKEREEMIQKVFKAIDDQIEDMKTNTQFYYDMQKKLLISIYSYTTTNEIQGIN